MKSSIYLVSALIFFILTAATTSPGYCQNVDFGISTQKACNSNRLSVTVTVNGRSYTTDEFGAYQQIRVPAGKCQITAFTPELPNTRIAYAEYWVNGKMENKFIGDASGAISPTLTNNGNLFIYLACDVKTVKVKIATTKSCTEAPNEGFSFQQGVTVSIGNKTFTSNANGVIDAELPAGRYTVNAAWKDYVLGYVAQNNLKQKRNEDGYFSVNLTENSEVLEVRMLTCDPNGQAKARATIIEGDFNLIRVYRSRSKGNAFPGMQLRDGDTVRMLGKTKLNWLDRNGLISFEQGGFIIIGPDAPAGTKAPKSDASGIRLLDGVMDLIMPPADHSLSDTGRFKASTRTIITSMKGTKYTVGYDPATNISTVTVREGSVWVNPVNTKLQRLTVEAGHQVQVSANFESPITAANINNPKIKFNNTSIIRISGEWIMQDGQKGQLVQITQNGSYAGWNYKGGNGHEKLVGTITGTFDGKKFAGTYSVKEGYSTSNGIINLYLNGDRLEGTWVSSTIAGQSGTYLLIRKPDNKTSSVENSFDNSNLAQEIIKLDKDRIKALEDADTAWLSRFYADDFIMITSTGEIRNKQDQLRDIGSGKIVHENIEEKYLRMRFYGNVAIVQSESKGKLIQNGIVSDDIRRFTRVFVKSNERWQLVSTHISRVTQNR